MRKTLYLLLILPLIFFSCSKNDDSTTSGCTDPLAINYDSLATVDDGSCEIAEDNIVGFWGIDDYLHNGSSLFEPNGIIESMTIEFYNDGTVEKKTFEIDNTVTTINGTWSLTSNNTLEWDEEGDLIIWTIVKINNSEIEIHASLELAGASYNAIMIGTKFSEGK